MVLDLIQICLKMLSESLIRSVMSNNYTWHNYSNMEENSDGHLYCWIEKLFGSPKRSGNESAHQQQQTNLLEKTCKRIWSDNFYLVIHLFIYCGWGRGGKKAV